MHSRTNGFECQGKKRDLPRLLKAEIIIVSSVLFGKNANVGKFTKWHIISEKKYLKDQDITFTLSGEI